MRAARDLFAQRGYAATSIGDISSEARVTPGALYHYVDSKRELFAELAEGELRKIHSEFERAIGDAEPSFVERFCAIMDVASRLYEKDPALAVFLSVIPIELMRHPEIEMSESVMNAMSRVLDLLRGDTSEQHDRDATSEGYEAFATIMLGLAYFGALGGGPAAHRRAVAAMKHLVRREHEPSSDSNGHGEGSSLRKENARLKILLAEARLEIAALHDQT